MPITERKICLPQFRFFRRQAKFSVKRILTFFLMPFLPHHQASWRAPRTSFAEPTPAVSSMPGRSSRTRQIADHLAHWRVALLAKASGPRFRSQTDVSDRQWIDPGCSRNVESNLLASSALQVHQALRTTIRKGWRRLFSLSLERNRRDRGQMERYRAW